ncbi:hypothetical protein CWR43_09615 [Rhizobium sullae]|uniref:Uncharacterized protein n=1 Tax=Rhizobium sullae TaxID=50338 RepID=A0A2N0DCP3_RHISU|nr:hypothetical protein [Rhizobium sullae]PKA43869.1 hypothetical protein CWR43_09615 [Rhizobium sullae]
MAFTLEVVGKGFRLKNADNIREIDVSPQQAEAWREIFAALPQHSWSSEASNDRAIDDKGMNTSIGDHARIAYGIR